jgi:hypothetical protein
LHVDEFLDEIFVRLKCMDEINSKTIMPNETTCTWMIVTKNMKHLDECGAQMNFWMIIESRRIIWMKIFVSSMYG